MKKKIINIIFLIIFMGCLIFPTNIWAQNTITKDIKIEEEKDQVFHNITAPNMLLGETNSERILYERNADEIIYPASITKLMTAILVVENCKLDEIVTVSENAVMSVPSGYVNANLQVGEEITVEDLLYAMLIPSANDAANALAEHIGGSIESFSTMMNTRAKELGCTSSNFTNPSGLHQEEHYTTCRDIYLISKEAISKEYIKVAINKTKYTLPQTNKYTGTCRIFSTTNYMKLQSLSKYYCDYCIGGKTGYTGEAKNCVVEFAEKDGIELIAIVMGENAKVKGQKFLDAKQMFEYVFENYENKKVATKNETYKKVKVNNGTKETKDLEILYKEDVNTLIEKNSNKEVEIKQEYTNLKAPIKKGDILGKITYSYDETEYSTDLIAGSDVEESKILEKTLRILIITLILYIIYNFKKSNKKYGNHGKKYNKKRKKKRI